MILFQVQNVLFLVSVEGDLSTVMYPPMVKKGKKYLREISCALVAMRLSIGVNEDFVGIH